jgi:hypothetical protein
MPDEPATLPPQDSTKANGQGAKPRTRPVANSALEGRVDYVDITERVAQGVTVSMPVDEVQATPGTQPLFSTDGAISIEAPEESTPHTNELDAKE